MKLKKANQSAIRLTESNCVLTLSLIFFWIFWTKFFFLGGGRGERGGCSPAPALIMLFRQYHDKYASMFLSSSPYACLEGRPFRFRFSKRIVSPFSSINFSRLKFLQPLFAFLEHWNVVESISSNSKLCTGKSNSAEAGCNRALLAN